MPLISVIIPTYNRLSFLKEAVASVEAQNFRDYELIVVDDGSNDGTAEWLAGKDIMSIYLKHSGLPGKVRNAGAAVAKGQYLAFLDSDDRWLPEKLAYQQRFFTQYAALAVCHTKEIWKRGRKIISQRRQRYQKQGYIFPDALHKCIIGPSTVMLTRDLFYKLGGFAEDLEIAEDYELWLRLTAQYEVGYIDKPLVEKRAGHADQLSAKYGQIEVFRLQALLRALALGTWTCEQERLIRATIIKKCQIYARGACKRGKIAEAENYLDLARRFAAAEA